MTSLKDGNIAQLYDAGSEIFLKVRNHARCLMQQMLNALSYLHGVKIVHRDVKPQNILFTKRGGSYHFQLADFGLSKFVAAQMSAHVGTAQFMALEVIRGEPVTYKSDIWSLLVTVLCTLEPAVRHERDLHRLRKMVMHVVESKYTEVVEMARESPEKRASADQMIQHLQAPRAKRTDVTESRPIMQTTHDAFGAADVAAHGLRAAAIGEENERMCVAERNPRCGLVHRAKDQGHCSQCTTTGAASFEDHAPEKTTYTPTRAENTPMVANARSGLAARIL